MQAYVNSTHIKFILPIKPVVKVRGGLGGAQPTMLRLGPHLLKSEPGLLIAEPVLLQQ